MFRMVMVEFGFEAVRVMEAQLTWCALVVHFRLMPPASPHSGRNGRHQVGGDRCSRPSRHPLELRHR